MRFDQLPVVRFSLLQGLKGGAGRLAEAIAELAAILVEGVL